MERSYNMNVNRQDLWLTFTTFEGVPCPVVFVPDPNDAHRGKAKFALDETATGGGILAATAKGGIVQQVRCNVPSTSANGIELGAESDPRDQSINVTPAGIDPFSIPLAVRRAYRGSIWTRRAPIPFGPRPGQPDNICAMDYLESFGPSDRAIMYDAYFTQAKYRHFPWGPPVDPGYHGQYPGVDFRTNPQYYAQVLQEAINAGGIPVLFASPDGWSQADVETLTSIYQMPEFQRVITEVVPYGWEPGTYNISNQQWCDRFAWAAKCFPRARLGIHMVADFDAPIGGSDQPPAGMDAKQWAWTNLYNAGCRFFLRQVGGYLNTGPALDPAFVQAFQQDLTWFVTHFRDWGLTDFDVIYGEGASYGNYWGNWPEATSKQLGDIALAVPGVMGAFDGCTVP